jgi:ABC-type spermidine/putrescine transport system permease subunit II
VIAIVLLGFTTMIIPLILFFASGTWEREWLIGSPVGVVGVTFAFNVTDIHVLVFNSLKIASVCAVLVGVLSVPWFVRQIRNFQPPKQNTANE